MSLIAKTLSLGGVTLGRMCPGCQSLCRFSLFPWDRTRRLLHCIHWELFWWADAWFRNKSVWENAYIFIGMNSIDFIKGVSLFFRPMQNIDNLPFFYFCVERIEYDLNSNVHTMRLSWTRMTSRSPEFCYFTLRGRIRMATVMFDYSYSLFIMGFGGWKLYRNIRNRKGWNSK